MHIEYDNIIYLLRKPAVKQVENYHRRTAALLLLY